MRKKSLLISLNFLKKESGKFTRYLMFFVCMSLIMGCSDNSMSADSDDQASGEIDIPEFGLFLSVAGDANGLHYVDFETAEVQKVGEGRTGAEEDAVGLTAIGAGEPLIGSNRFAILQIQPDGSNATVIGNPSGQAFTEGLAYNPDNDVVYASSNGFLHVRNIETGATIETVLNPPNQPDIEGLAFDARNEILYGLARGSVQQSEFFRGLYVLDASQPKNQWQWEAVGDTGGIWANAGLAFDQINEVLFATGRQDDPGALFLIDPETGNTTRLGNTGLDSAEGGLAWLPPAGNN